MGPGPCQAAGVAALSDQDHVTVQRELYRERIAAGQALLAAAGIESSAPRGGFYLWAAAPEGDAWRLAARLADEAGVLVSPGEFYGPAGAAYVRVALVRPVEDL